MSLNKTSRALLNVVCITGLLTITGCSPSLYLIDRQTVLELEASGDWQELDRSFRGQELQAGPIPLERTREKNERRSVLGMTHGDDSTISSNKGR